MKRKNILVFINFAIPLLSGLSIYLFCYENTYINTTIQKFFDISLPYFYYDNIFYHFLTCWACDILWAYSLTFSLYSCFKNFNHSLLVSYIISSVFALIIELLQLFNVITGTFDILDILLEFSAIILAVIIIKKEFSK